MVSGGGSLKMGDERGSVSASVFSAAGLSLPISRKVVARVNVRTRGSVSHYRLRLCVSVVASSFRLMAAHRSTALTHVPRARCTPIAPRPRAWRIGTLSMKVTRDSLRTNQGSGGTRNAMEHAHERGSGNADSANAVRSSRSFIARGFVLRDAVSSLRMKPAGRLGVGRPRPCGKAANVKQGMDMSRCMRQIIQVCSDRTVDTFGSIG